MATHSTGTDTASPVARSRLEEILSEALGPDEFNDHLSNVHYYHTPTLSHLLALILHPPALFPAPSTGLLVIDGLHTLLDTAYPRNASSTSYASKTEAAKWSAGRRYSVLGTIVAALKKLAALHDLAIVVTTGCATRARPGSGLGAAMVPGVGGGEWDSGITHRLVLFRDMRSRRHASSSQNIRTQDVCRSARYIGIQKLNGTNIAEDGEPGHVIPFEVGVVSLSCRANGVTGLTRAIVWRH